MKVKIFPLTLLLLTLPFVAHANAFDGGGIFSLDARYLGTAIKNNGWGLGVAYEQPIKTFASVKGMFSHVSLMPTEEHDWITTVGLGMEARGYPFNRGMELLYLGWGIGTDFIMFTELNNQSNTYISHCPVLGWKQNFFDYVMLDARIAYRMMISEPDTFALEHGIVSHGFEYGIAVQVNLQKIFSLFF